jgi:hypothetical protein
MVEVSVLTERAVAVCFDSVERELATLFTSDIFKCQNRVSPDITYTSAIAVVTRLVKPINDKIVKNVTIPISLALLRGKSWNFTSKAVGRMYTMMTQENPPRILSTAIKFGNVIAVTSANATRLSVVTIWYFAGTASPS